MYKPCTSMYKTPAARFPASSFFTCSVLQASSQSISCTYNVYTREVTFNAPLPSNPLLFSTVTSDLLQLHPPPHLHHFMLMERRENFLPFSALVTPYVVLPGIHQPQKKKKNRGGGRGPRPEAVSTISPYKNIPKILLPPTPHHPPYQSFTSFNRFEFVLLRELAGHAARDIHRGSSFIGGD